MYHFPKEFQQNPVLTYFLEHQKCLVGKVCTFFVTFSSATIDGRNLIFGHKLYIGTPYRAKRFLTRQIPTSCLPILEHQKCLVGQVLNYLQIGFAHDLLKDSHLSQLHLNLKINVKMFLIIIQFSIGHEQSQSEGNSEPSQQDISDVPESRSELDSAETPLESDTCNTHICEVAEENVTKNVHICSMCIKIN
jgi:hypothetical protein